MPKTAPPLLKTLDCPLAPTTVAVAPAGREAPAARA